MRMGRSAITFAALIGVVGAGAVAEGQGIRPVGVRALPVRFEECITCSAAVSASVRYETAAAFPVPHSRQSHILIGFVSGVAVGVATGAIVANQAAKRCHAESCQVQAALGGLGDMIEGGFFGAVVGTTVGALWPVRRLSVARAEPATDGPGRSQSITARAKRKARCLGAMDDPGNPDFRLARSRSRQSR
jgi:hypothetical protein